ncbi:uncharacterized protein LOC103571438 [Microplitis demolitor]|uniref:uncharacterized protein LOC103571438 n=1 Tax=Microplitis demolitor TaxID=69319 RepID=UPI0004400331|nr:uncharacterized protein LOC103571438 [Microplitis demolitor]
MALGKIRLLNKHLTRNASSLFIPGSKATDSYSFLSPYLDFDERFTDLDKLSYQLRCRKMPVDIQAIRDSWEFYKSIDQQRQLIESQREELASRIKKLKKESKDSIEDLKTQGAILRHDLRVVKEVLWQLEETVIIRALNLPNDLDDKTPLEPVVLRSHGRKPTGTSSCHTEIGSKRHLVEYINPLHYYLADDAALLELAATKWVSTCFSDFIRVSGSDFARDFVIEASGRDHTDPKASFILTDHSDHEAKLGKLHLVGGSSLAAFLSMHTKQLINSKILPLRYYAVGRQYTPTVGKADPGLFNVCQSTTVDCFTITKTDSELNEEFTRLVDVITRVYDNLGRHYRVVLRAAHELKPWECLRVSFELWSRHSQKYIEVGNLSTHGSYFSKRLLIAFQTSTGRSYPAVIAGTVISVPRLLGCLIEDRDDFVPEIIKQHMNDVCN